MVAKLKTTQKQLKQQHNNYTKAVVVIILHTVSHTVLRKCTPKIQVAYKTTLEGNYN